MPKFVKIFAHHAVSILINYWNRAQCCSLLECCSKNEWLISYPTTMYIAFVSKQNNHGRVIHVTFGSVLKTSRRACHVFVVQLVKSRNVFYLTLIKYIYNLSQLKNRSNIKCMWVYVFKYKEHTKKDLFFKCTVLRLYPRAILVCVC